MPRTYAVSFKADAVKELGAIPPKHQQQIVDRIAALALDPRPPGCKPLKGRSRGLFRLRSGEYRIVYQVDDTTPAVTVTKIGTRQDVYHGM